MKDEPIDWEESIDPSESLTIDHEIDIKPVCKIKRTTDCGRLCFFCCNEDTVISFPCSRHRRSCIVRTKMETWRKRNIHR